MKDLGRWRGVKALAQDMVEHGSRAVEQVHRRTAARSFKALQFISPIAPVVRSIQSIHDASVSSVHLAIRTVNRAIGGAADAVFDIVEKRGNRD